jgi:hypothetical protein
MSNILTARLTIQGTRPILFHRFGPDAIPATSGRRERTGAAGNDPEEWRRSVMVTSDSTLYLEPPYLFGCLRDGAKFTPRKRSSLQPLVASTLLVLDERILLDRSLPDPLLPDPEQPVYLDIRSVRNPTTRARNVRYRVAARSGWQVNAQIQWDRTIVSREEMQAVAIDAGRLVGLGDGRTIGFGRFTVLAFHITD